PPQTCSDSPGHWTSSWGTAVSSSAARPWRTATCWACASTPSATGGCVRCLAAFIGTLPMRTGEDSSGVGTRSISRPLTRKCARSWAAKRWARTPGGSANSASAMPKPCQRDAGATCPDEEVGNGREALCHARRVCELTAWKEPLYLDTLAAACTEESDFRPAVEWQRKAVESPSFSTERLPEARARLELYQAGQPSRKR